MSNDFDIRYTAQQKHCTGSNQPRGLTMKRRGVRYFPGGRPLGERVRPNPLCRAHPVI